jgi:hypothetical protein
MLGVIIILTSLLAASTSPTTATSSGPGAGTSTGTWLTFAAAILAVLASVTGILVVRRSARETNAVAKQAADASTKAANASTAAAAASKEASDELDVWRKREETMRMLRWAADNAVKDGGVVADAGVAILDALQGSTLIQADDKPFVGQVVEAVVDAVAHAIVDPAASKIEAGDKVVQE